MNKIITDLEKIKNLLTRNVEEVIVKKELEEKLKSGGQLRIKWGVDPSRPDLHLGHSAVLKKLKEFQELGHRVTFLIGDFTGMIGDPSGKSKTRPMLSREEVLKNSKSYFDQVGKVLDLKKTEIRYNSEWYSELTLEEILKIASKFTIARILERDDFTKRFKSGVDIAVSEFMYPMMQAYDSIMINADVEIGATDQKFNMLAGRELAKKMGLIPQNVLMTPLLAGLDGARKMSKSLGNYVGIAESPNSMFGKIMSISDDMIFYYFKLLTDLSENELKQIESDLKNPSKNPRDLKARLAGEIIAIYHGKNEAEKAEKEFNRIFRDKQKPSDIKSCKLQVTSCKLVDLLVELKMAHSKSEAQRLLRQGGVKINDIVQKDWKMIIEIKNGMIVQVGKRKFMKIVI